MSVGTTHVRIPVLVRADGKTYAHRYSESPDESASAYVRRGFDHYEPCAWHVVWIEADVPLPIETIIVGTATEVEHAEAVAP